MPGVLDQPPVSSPVKIAMEVQRRFQSDIMGLQEQQKMVQGLETVQRRENVAHGQEQV